MIESPFHQKLYDSGFRESESLRVADGSDPDRSGQERPVEGLSLA